MQRVATLITEHSTAVDAASRSVAPLSSTEKEPVESLSGDGPLADIEPLTAVVCVGPSEGESLVIHSVVPTVD